MILQTKKKTLVDFIGNINTFKTILQMKVDENGERFWDKYQKDKVLKHLYKKRPKKTKD